MPQRASTPRTKSYRLRDLGPTTGRDLDASVILNFEIAIGKSYDDLSVLTETERDFSGAGVMNQPPPQSETRVADPDVDLGVKPQASRRILTFQKSNQGLRRQLNTHLRGGPSFPVLAAAASISIGLFSAPAGIAYTAFTAGFAAASGPPQEVLAREQDELWFVERVGKWQGDPTHQEVYLIRDPVREQHAEKGTAAAWIIHEERHALELS